MDGQRVDGMGEGFAGRGDAREDDRRRWGAGDQLDSPPGARRGIGAGPLSRVRALQAMAGLAVAGVLGVARSPGEPAASRELLKTLWAVVGSSGDLRRGKGVRAVQRFGTGEFKVTFNRDVSSCAYVATTIDYFAGTTGIGEYSAREILVYTLASGNRVDLPFSVVVTC